MIESIRGYPRFGGQHIDTSVLSNVFEQAGLYNPITQSPYSEAMLAGLGGGIGFLYMVYEFQDAHPQLRLTVRHQTRRWSFVDSILSRTIIQRALARDGMASGVPAPTRTSLRRPSRTSSAT